MHNFNLGALAQWRQIAVGEIVDFDVPETGTRHVQFDVMASDRVIINAVSGDDYWLVGVGSGEVQCKFVIERPTGVVVIGDKETDVFLRTFVDAAVIPESVDASYTTIEPRRAGPSDDLKRMMRMVQLNSMRREQALLEEVRALKRRDALVEPDPQPAVAPRDPRVQPEGDPRDPKPQPGGDVK